jgi:hypothetical protein
MKGSRLASFNNLRDNIEADGDVQLKLITFDNFMEYEKPEWPYPEAVTMRPGLSGVHRSDYLRTYFMHNYGGCYHDVKPLPGPPHLGKLIDELRSEPDTYLIGAPELAPGFVDCDPEYATKLNVTCVNLHHHWKHLFSNGMYMARSHTEMSRTWLTILDERLADKLPQLRKHPSPVPGRCCLPGTPRQGYPFIWVEIHGQVSQSCSHLFAKYHIFCANT